MRGTGDSRFDFLDSHAQVIARLLGTGVTLVAFFSPRSKLLWCMGDASGRNLRLAIRQVLKSEGEDALTFGSGQVACKFPLHDHGYRAGATCVVVLEPGQPDATTDVQELAARIAPALACAQQILAPRDVSMLAIEDALQWLMDIDAGGDFNPDPRDAIANLLASANRHLRCVAGRVVVPDSSLEETCIVGELDSDAADRILRRLVAPVMGRLTRQDRSIVTNATGSRRIELPFKLLAAAVADRSGRVAGAVLLLRSAEAPDFGRIERLLAEGFGRRVGMMVDAWSRRPRLLNRPELHERMRSWSESSPPDPGHCIVHIHVDGLQAVNEALGFEAGDAIVEQIAGLLNAPNLLRNALAARLSGNVFVLAMPDTAVPLARRCARALQQAVESMQRRHPADMQIVRLSCGIAAFNSPRRDFPHVLTLAEIAAKAARRRGGARIEVYEDTDPSMIRRRLDVITLGKFQNIIATNQLTLYAQWIQPLQGSGGPRGFEVLLRRSGEGQSNAAPSDILSAAHSYGLEPVLDLWVVRNTLEAAAGFATALSRAGISLSINVSGPSLSDQTFLRGVRHWFRQTRVPPTLVTFEITETAALSNVAQARRFMHEMRAMGCRFALDDFGTGVNSLKNLKELKVDRVKIDGGFVTDLLTNASSLATVRAIVALAAELGIETVAEFAASATIVERLRELGVTCAQGNAIAVPGPLVAALEQIGAREEDDGRAD